jgi:hypothetical protein
MAVSPAFRPQWWAVIRHQATQVNDLISVAADVSWL